MRDLRAEPAKFYDLIPTTPDDIPFYVDRLPSAESRVLELGCGTGRVAIPLAAHCRSVHGLDLSEAMIRIGLSKVSAAGLANRVRLEVGDISSFELPQRFNFIIAPFRVFQKRPSLSASVRVVLSARNVGAMHASRPVLGGVSLCRWTPIPEGPLPIRPSGRRCRNGGDGTDTRR